MDDGLRPRRAADTLGHPRSPTVPKVSCSGILRPKDGWQSEAVRLQPVRAVGPPKKAGGTTGVLEQWRVAELALAPVSPVETEYGSDVVDDHR